jgi:hypothetical protein
MSRYRYIYTHNKHPHSKKKTTEKTNRWNSFSTGQRKKIKEKTVATRNSQLALALAPITSVWKTFQNFNPAMGSIVLCVTRRSRTGCEFSGGSNVVWEDGFCAAYCCRSSTSSQQQQKDQRERRRQREGQTKLVWKQLQLDVLARDGASFGYYGGSTVLYSTVVFICDAVLRIVIPFVSSRCSYRACSSYCTQYGHVENSREAANGVAFQYWTGLYGERRHS